VFDAICLPEKIIKSIGKGNGLNFPLTKTCFMGLSKAEVKVMALFGFQVGIMIRFE